MPMGSAAADADPIIAIGVALLNVTLIQTIGYMMKSYDKVNAEVLSGIGAFGGLVSLPCLLFKSVATLDFTTVPLELVCAVTVGKLGLIAICGALGYIKTKSEDREKGGVELSAGMFALMTTNSDDLGLGLPVMGAIFPPNIVKFCFVLGAMQTGVFNPLIFIILGIGKSKRDKPDDGSAAASTGAIVRTVLRGLLSNFIILAILSGLAYNLIFGLGRGAALPGFLLNLTTTLGSAFGPIVLFMAGAANVGSFGQLAVLDSALLPLLTVLLKSIVLPTCAM